MPSSPDAIVITAEYTSYLRAVSATPAWDRLLTVFREAERAREKVGRESYLVRKRKTPSYKVSPAKPRVTDGARTRHLQHHNPTAYILVRPNLLANPACTVAVNGPRRRVGVLLFLGVLQVKEGRARQDSNLRPADFQS